MDWIHLFGLIILILMLIPNVIYACKTKNDSNQCTNRLMNLVEQIGRYGSMFFMVFHIGLLDLGFHSKPVFLIWAISMPILIALYWIFWVFYFKKPKSRNAMLLALIPSAIFLLHGLAIRDWFLVLFGVMFSIGHHYITYTNHYGK